MGVNIGYHHLNFENRYMIMGLAQEGFSLERIAKRCQVSPSTVSRELKRQLPEEVSLAFRCEKYSATAAKSRYMMFGKIAPLTTFPKVVHEYPIVRFRQKWQRV